MQMRDIVNYKPYAERTPDKQYQDLLKDVLDNGRRGETQQEVDAITLMGARPMRFRLDNGFPMITERNLNPVMKKLPVTIWQQAIGEICGFINGARTTAELEKFGCYWWDSWCTEEKCHKRGLETGDLGPGSYGAAFHDFPTSEGPSFNQFEHLVRQIKENPQLRTHFITPWIPQYIYRVEGMTQKVVVCPCHGWIHVRVIDNKLTLHMFQRSGDTPIGVPSNMIQYAALTLMLAHVTGTEPYEYVHTISDAHIFVDQVPAVEKVIAREPIPLPTIKINTEKKNIFDFRREDFELSDYNPHPGIKGIPVAI
ncbi:MAG: thymidylate synthase [Patescibacteria group bacterium]